MLRQIAPVPQKTTRLGVFTADLLQAHNLQARVRGRTHGDCKPESGVVSSPGSGLPHTVTILRWIE